MPEIIRAVREQFYRGASHIKLMATEILNRHEDIRLLFGTDMMITGPDYQVEQSEDIRYYEKRFGTMRALRALTGTANEVFALTTYQNLTRRERSVCWRRDPMQICFWWMEIRQKVYWFLQTPIICA